MLYAQNLCRLLPWLCTGQRGAPTIDDWVTLNRTLDGRLVHGVPYARACFESSDTPYGAWDNETCSNSVIPNYLEHFSVTSHVGGYTNTQFQECLVTGDSCVLDTSQTSNTDAFSPPKVCGQGSVPRYAINLGAPDDAIKGFEFAKTHGLQVVIKNTGHDWQGRSSGPNTLAFWTHNLKSIEYHSSFRPSMCGDGDFVQAVTIGAGVQFAEIIDYADKNKLTIPTGGDLSVGAAGGFLQGGGHSIVSPTFGLAVDRALEFELVTARGEHLIANRCQNRDLFFAIRGSPSSVGVVLKATVMAFSQMKLSCALATYNGVDDVIAHKIAEYITDNALQWAADGWGYYAEPSKRIHFVNAVLPFFDAKRSLSELEDFVVNKLGGSFKITLEPNYKAMFDNYISALVVPSGMHFTVGSRLIPKHSLLSERFKKDIVQAMDDIRSSVGDVIVFGVAPYNYTAKDPELTSVTPAWRDAVWHLAFTDMWNYDASKENVEKVFQGMGEASDKLIELTPGSGSYQNEAHIYQSNFEHHYWGDNYPKLLEVKRKYDPYHLLNCWQCVGWTGPQDPQFRCFLDMHKGFQGQRSGLRAYSVGLVAKVKGLLEAVRSEL